MAISDAFVEVTCDAVGCPESDRFELTALARHGSYDMRGIDRAVETAGWVKQPNGDYYCENCAAAEE